MSDWRALFSTALPYDAFLNTHGNPERRRRWDAIREKVAMEASQRALLAGFTRQMNVLCVAATWCGDCANQGSILETIAASSPRITLRFLDRDTADPAVLAAVRINGGERVPIAVFLSEDFEDCGHYGDRTLSFYRQMAEEMLGPACSTGLVPPSAALLSAGVREWLVEFERIQWMLRLTGRLRELHGD